MRLSAPTLPVFLISIVLAAIVIAVKYFGVSGIPYIGGRLFETLLAAYAVLLAGNLFRGL
ncbi:MAG: hypothetical protein OEM91_13420 [Hyphomicrobiales bacterium]|nr:hypothetical protein [Hyphomicrobiales bacterium]